MEQHGVKLGIANFVRYCTVLVLPYSELKASFAAWRRIGPLLAKQREDAVCGYALLAIVMWRYRIPLLLLRAFLPQLQGMLTNQKI
jgi:hypothetical protein